MFVICPLHRPRIRRSNWRRSSAPTRTRKPSAARSPQPGCASWAAFLPLARIATTLAFLSPIALPAVAFEFGKRSLSQEEALQQQLAAALRERDTLREQLAQAAARRGTATGAGAYGGYPSGAAVGGAKDPQEAARAKRELAAAVVRARRVDAQCSLSAFHCTLLNKKGHRPHGSDDICRSRVQAEAKATEARVRDGLARILQKAEQVQARITEATAAAKAAAPGGGG